MYDITKPSIIFLIYVGVSLTIGSHKEHCLLEVVLLILDPEGNPSWTRLAEGETRVGRGVDNDLVLAGRGVSRHHALFSLDAGILMVKDLDSTYGTRVCGATIRQKQVGLGDSIDMGTFRVLPLPASAMRTKSGAVGLPHFEASTPTPFNFADTVEYQKAYTPVHIFMGAPQPTENGPWSADGEAHAQVTGGPPGSPWRVQLVDQWGTEALAKVIRSTADLGRAETPYSVKSDEFSKTALHGLRQLAELVAAEHKIEQALQASVDIVARVVEVDTAVILEALEEHRFQPRAVRHSGPLESGEVPVSRTVVYKALREGAPVISENLSTDPDYSAKDSVHMYRVGALMAIPAIVDEQVVGVLYLSRGAGRTFNETEVSFALSVAVMVGGLLQRGRHRRRTVTDKFQQSMLARLLGTWLADQVREGIDPTRLDTIRATVLSVVLPDFDRVTATLPTDRLLTIFADFHTVLREVIGSNGGQIITAREGKAVALFGLPEPKRTDAIWAVNAALDLVRQYDSNVRRRLGLTSGLACGLSSGEVLTGVVGNTTTLEPVALGPCVSLARRLASLASSHAVIIEEETLNQIPAPNFHVEPFDTEELKDLPGHFYIVAKKQL